MSAAEETKPSSQPQPPKPTTPIDLVREEGTKAGKKRALKHAMTAFVEEENQTDAERLLHEAKLCRMEGWITYADQDLLKSQFKAAFVRERPAFVEDSG